jgi:hypothetical protein
VAARRVNQLESAAEPALDRLAALTGMLAQPKELAGLHEPDAAAAAALYAAAVCRDARALFRSVDALGKRPAVVAVVVNCLRSGSGHANATPDRPIGRPARAA